MSRYAKPCPQWRVNSNTAANRLITKTSLAVRNAVPSCPSMHQSLLHFLISQLITKVNFFSQSHNYTFQSQTSVNSEKHNYRILLTVTLFTLLSCYNAYCQFTHLWKRILAGMGQVPSR